MYQGKYAAPRGTKKPKRPVRKPQKRRSRTGTIVFYCAYLLIFPLFFFGIFSAMDMLEDWLVKYEASQPDIKCAEVYQELFQQPDWAKLYATAGIQSTKFEGADSFVTYMSGTVDPAKLTYNETSAGLSGDHKYVVKHNNEKIAAFTLTSDAESEMELAQWRLGKLEFFYEAKESVTVTTLPGRTVSVNGITLDDSYMVKTTTTVAEKYLPEGLQGNRTQTYLVTGLLAAPKVTVTDPEGVEVELVYDPQSGSYTEPLPTPSYEDVHDTIVKTAQTYCKYMIRAISGNQLKYYFDRNSPIHNNIYYNETWMQSYKDYRLDEAVVSDYVRYSDELFSARVTLKMYVTRNDGSVREYSLDTNFFFSLIGKNWLATSMTNVDVQEPITQVRLSYYVGDELLRSEFVDAVAATLTLPEVSAPEGQVFTGWFRQTLDENGKSTYALVFEPGQTTVTLPADVELEPMTLFAMFRKGE